MGSPPFRVVRSGQALDRSGLAATGSPNDYCEAPRRLMALGTSRRERPG
jgi:hypothetical protein